MHEVMLTVSVGAIGGAACVLLGKGLLAGAKTVERWEEGQEGWKKVALEIAKWTLVAFAAIATLTGTMLGAAAVMLFVANLFAPSGCSLKTVGEGLSLGALFVAPTFYFAMETLHEIGARFFSNNYLVRS